MSTKRKLSESKELSPTAQKLVQEGTREAAVQSLAQGNIELTEAFKELCATYDVEAPSMRWLLSRLPLNLIFVCAEAQPAKADSLGKYVPVDHTLTRSEFMAFPSCCKAALRPCLNEFVKQNPTLKTVQSALQREIISGGDLFYHKFGCSGVNRSRGAATTLVMDLLLDLLNSTDKEETVSDQEQDLVHFLMPFAESDSKEFDFEDTQEILVQYVRKVYGTCHGEGYGVPQNLCLLVGKIWLKHGKIEPRFADTTIGDDIPMDLLHELVEHETSPDILLLMTSHSVEHFSKIARKYPSALDLLDVRSMHKVLRKIRMNDRELWCELLGSVCTVTKKWMQHITNPKKRGYLR